MRKFLYVILGIVIICGLFGAGFYVGTLDNKETKSEMKITSQCAGSGIQKSFSAKYETKNGKVVKDEQVKSEQYTTRCLCYVSNDTYEKLWVDTVEMYADSADAVKAECETNCQKVCEERLAEFSL